MCFNKELVAYGMVVCISILLSSCAPSTLKDQRLPTDAAATDAQSPTCGDLLTYYSRLAKQTDEQISSTDMTTLSVEHLSDVCPKLREAIFLSYPGSKQQNDQEALELLNDLKRSGVLYGSDLQFNNMLLQHVSQRQDLREQIAAQKKHFAKVETQNNALRNQLTILQSQLDQLRDIEVEIDKKERSFTSPINN